MKTHHLKKYIILALIIQSCAPTIKIVDRHPNNQKKSSEVYRSKYFGEALQKRLEYFSNGQIKSETNYRQEQKHGKYVSYFINGSMSAEGEFKNNKKNGRWAWLDKSGKLDSIFHYKNGRLNGSYEIYNQGRISIKQNYKSGRLNGKITEFYANGNIKNKGSYLDDAPNNKWEWFSDNKQISRLIHFKNGVKNGDFKVWNGDTLILSGSYLSDKRDGTWKWYRSKKQLDSLVTYSNGQLNGDYKKWNKEGAMKISGSFTNDNRDGEWRWFSNSEDVDSSKTYALGVLDGATHIYYINGQLKKKQYFRSGLLEGETASYYISGQLQSKTQFKLNEKTGPFELWTSAGQLEERGAYLKNKYHGPIQRNFSTGQLASAATYSRGVLDGISQIFTPSGSMVKEIFYKMGSEIARIEYHDNGRFKKVIALDDKLKVYEREWNTDGFENTRQIYITGTRTKADYYLTGQLKYECIYKGDNKHGMEWWFDEQRNPVKINIYNNGVQLVSHNLLYDSDE